MIALVMLGSLIFGPVIYPLLERCFPTLGIATIEATQFIDNYFKSCDDLDRNWSI
jgi:archaellum component FlaF (FlaF/FlaG flagellin family)